MALPSRSPAAPPMHAHPKTGQLLWCLAVLLVAGSELIAQRAQRAPSPELALNAPIRGLQELGVSSGGDSPFATLAAYARIPLGVEVMPEVAADPRLRSLLPALVVSLPSDVPLAAAIRLVQGQLPGYELHTDNGVISMAPSVLLRDASHFMNRPIAKYEATDLPFISAIQMLQGILQPEASRPSVSADAAARGNSRNPAGAVSAQKQQDLLNRHVTVSLTGASPRQILDRLIAEHGALIWEMDYFQAQPPARAEAKPDNYVLKISAFHGEGMGTAFVAHRAKR